METLGSVRPGRFPFPMLTTAPQRRRSAPDTARKVGDVHLVVPVPDQGGAISGRWSSRSSATHQVVSSKGMPGPGGMRSAIHAAGATPGGGRARGRRSPRATARAEQAPSSARPRAHARRRPRNPKRRRRGRRPPATIRDLVTVRGAGASRISAKRAASVARSKPWRRSSNAECRSARATSRASTAAWRSGSRRR